MFAGRSVNASNGVNVTRQSLPGALGTHSLLSTACWALPRGKAVRQRPDLDAGPPVQTASFRLLIRSHPIFTSGGERRYCRGAICESCLMRDIRKQRHLGEGTAHKQSDRRQAQGALLRVSRGQTQGQGQTWAQSMLSNTPHCPM